MALPETIPTFTDAWHKLGRVPLDRILLQPAPGTALEEDVTRLDEREDYLCERVDGTLVRKPPGFFESVLAVKISCIIGEWVESRGRGIVLWKRLPDRRIPTEPIPDLAPDIAVEALRSSNTAEEMARKRGEYFAAGCRSVWLVDADARTIAAYSSPDVCLTLKGAEAVTAEAVLPGFRIAVEEVLRRAGVA
jgi:Uma2 family endonuclease